MPYDVKTRQYIHRYLDGWERELDSELDSESTLVLVFGSSNYYGRSGVFKDLKQTFLKSTIVGCSGGGVVWDDEIMDDTLTVSVIQFERTMLKAVGFFTHNNLTPEETGSELFRMLRSDDLASILILGDGLSSNGERMLRGLEGEDLGNITIWGGMAGDGLEFRQNWLYQDGKLAKSGLIGVGFYGDSIEIRTHVGLGWKDLGPQRVITTSDGNRVFGMDNQSILDIYMNYLGEYSRELPSIGARYPLMVLDDGTGGSGYLRSVVEVNRKTYSMRFAGNVPEGSIVQMKRGDLHSLLAGADEVSQEAAKGYSSVDEGLVISFNCIGRRVVLGEQAKLELEQVRACLPEAMPVVGFYSLGEIAQSKESGRCAFFNETITLVTIVERNGSTD